jgi:hypothetical protein
MTHHPIVAEIGKKLFYVRDSLGRIFQYECFFRFLRGFPRVDNISGPLLIRIMRSGLDRGDFNLRFRNAC